MAPPPIRFFLDQNVADSVGRALQEAGFEVTYLREVLATNSPDQLVALITMRVGAVLVSHDGDFRSMAANVGLSQRRFRRLSRICLRCPEPDAATRIRAALSLIEHEWNQLHADGGERLWVDIGSSFIRCNR